MRLVKRKEFMTLPIGTVFSYYEPSCFSELMIKASDLTEGWQVDFLYDSLIGEIETSGSTDFVKKCDRMELGESIKMDFEQTGREGLFDEERWYAIYEVQDVEKLIKRLQDALLQHNLIKK